MKSYNCPVCDEQFDHECDVVVYFCDFCLARLELCHDADYLGAEAGWVDFTSVREIKAKWYPGEMSIEAYITALDAQDAYYLEVAMGLVTKWRRQSNKFDRQRIEAEKLESFKMADHLSAVSSVLMDCANQLVQSFNLPADQTGEKE